MRRSEYIRRLDEALSGIDPASRKEIIDEFEAHFDEGIMNGRSEEEIAAELGSPEQAAGDLRMLRKDEDTAKRIKVTASSLVEVIRNSLASGLDTVRSGQKIPQRYEGTSDNTFRKIQICGELASVDIDLKRGEQLEYTFIEGVNLFMPNEVQFETEETEDTFKVIVRNGHGDLSLLVPSSAEQLDIRITNGDVTIHDLVLKDAAIENRSGDIEIYDTEADTLSLHSASGDVTLVQANTGKIICELISGDIEITECTGDLKAKTLSGDIEIMKHEGEEADLTCKSGDIELQSSAVRIRSETASGDIEIETLSEPEEISALSVSGDIHLDLRGSDWQAVLQTTSGEIKNKTRQREYREGAKVCIGEGSGRITARSVSGDIRIR